MALQLATRAPEKPQEARLRAHGYLYTCGTLQPVRMALRLRRITMNAEPELETIGEGSGMSVQQLGELAQELLDQRDMLVKKQGGLTPEQLQEIAGRWGQAVNEDFKVRTVPQLLLDLAQEYHVIYDDGHEATIQEWCAALLQLAMHVADRNVVDLYEATFQYIGGTLENVTVLAREERVRRGRHNANNQV